MRFLKKVEEKVKRFTEVERLLEDPAIANDQSRVKDLGREYKNLEKITQAYHDYLKIP